jgi:O-antigen/teichoic acid export membrane protein
LITFPYSSRVLLPGGIGKVNFSLTVVSYFSLIAGLGITTYGIREAAKLKNDRKALSGFSSQLFTINLLSTAFAYILFFLAVFFIPALLDYRLLLLAAGAIVIFNTLGMEWLYTALEEYHYITIRSIGFQCICLVLLFVFVRTKEDFLKYLLITVFSSTGSNFLNFIYSRKFVDLRIQINRGLKKHFKFIITMFSMALVSNVYTALDSTMVGLISGDAEVGIYSAATKINRMTVELISAASVVLLPRLSYYAGENNREKFSLLFHKGLCFLFLFSIPSVIGIYLLSPSIVDFLLDKSYYPSIPVMQVMSPVIFIISLNGMIGVQYFIPLGKEKITFISILTGAVLNVLLNLVLIPAYGAFGAGIATLCSESIIMLIQIYFIRKSLDYKMILVNFSQIIISSIVMGIVVLSFTAFIKNPLPQIVVSVAAGVTIYMISLIVLKNSFVASFIREKLGRRKTNSEI